MNAENESNKKIVQHNNLINGRFDITNAELRIFIYMLMHINKDDNEFKLCRIPIKEIMQRQGGNSYKLIKKIADNLLKKTFKLETISMRKNKEVRTYVGYTIFSKSRYADGENHLEMMFNSEIKDYLLNLKGNFTSAEWKQLMDIKTVNGYRIYWLLKQYQTFGERLIEINTLKEMLMLKNEKTGVYKYSDFNNFKVRVLDVAQSELENTDMAFSFEGVKNGKSFYAVQFKLNNKAAKPTPCVVIPTPSVITIDGYSETQQKAYGILKRLGVNEAVVKTYVDAIDPQFILAANYQSQLKQQNVAERKQYIVAELDREMTRLHIAKRNSKIAKVLNS
jgi:plasmid replication initiation protein